VAKACKLNESRWGVFEHNHGYPNRLTLLDIARGTGIPVYQLVDAANYTYYHDDLPMLTRLFPGQSVFVDSHSQDLEKMRKFDQRPGTMEHLLFAYRKSYYVMPSVIEFNEQFTTSAENLNYWQRREAGATVNLANRYEWKDLFDKLPLPEPLLDGIYEAHGFANDGIPFLLAKALGPLSYEEASQRTGIPAGSIKNLVYLGITPTLASIAQLKKGLPDLDHIGMIRAVHPRLAEVFPNLFDPLNPYLDVSSRQVHDALAGFNLPVLSFAYRMDRNLGYKEMGRRVGASQNLFKTLEITGSNLEEDTHMIAIGRELADYAGMSEPDFLKIVTLYFRPGLLQLLPIKGRTPKMLDAADYERWMRVRESNRRVKLLRAHIRDLRAKYDLKKDEDYGKALALPEPEEGLKRLGVKMTKFDPPPTVTQLQALVRLFPELNYREVYETFFSPPLRYFLGTTAKGKINYQLAEGRTLTDLNHFDAYAFIDRSVRAKFKSFKQAYQQTKFNPFGRAGELKVAVDQRNLTLENLAAMSRYLEWSFEERRWMYLWLRQEELSSMLKAANP